MGKFIKDPVKFNFVSAAAVDGIFLFFSFNFAAVYWVWRIFFLHEAGFFASVLKIIGYWAAMWVTVAVFLPSAVSMAAMFIAKKMYDKGKIKWYRIFMGVCYAVMAVYSSFILLYSVLSMGGIMRILLALSGAIILMTAVIGALNTFSKKILADVAKGE